MLLLLLLLVPAAAQSPTPDDPLAVAETKVESALEELRALERRIKAEKSPLIENITALQEMVASRRKTLQTETEAARDAGRTIEELKQSIQREREALSRIRAIIDDVLGLFESRAHPETIHRLEEILDRARAGSARGQVRFLSTLATEFSDSVGWRERTVDALDPEGLLREGSGVFIGPLGLFFEPSGSFAGFLFPGRDLRPRLTPAPETAPDLTLTALFSGQTVRVPIDPSLGSAPLHASSPIQQLFAHLAQGGIWIYPILALGALSSLIVVLKFVQLARQDPDPDFPPGLGAEALAEPARSVVRTWEPLAETTSAAVCQEALNGAILRVQRSLERGLSVLSVTASTAPLLGLLGTVTGIIQTFQVIATTSGNDPRALSGGISEALVSTEVGLVVAIPALIAHAFFSRRVQGMLQRLDTFAAQLSARGPGPASPS